METHWGVVINVTNIVATSSAGCRLDLKCVAMHARNVVYDPKVSVRQ